MKAFNVIYQSPEGYIRWLAVQAKTKIGAMKIFADSYYILGKGVYAV